MKRLLSYALLLMVAAFPATADITISGGGAPGAPPPTTTVASLPTCNAGNEGARRTVTDAADETTCSSGGGSADNVCVCHDGTWELEGASGLTSGDKGDITVGGTWEIDANAVGSAEIGADQVGQSELFDANVPTDGNSLTYESTGAVLEWEARVAGAATGGGLASTTGAETGELLLGMLTSCSTNQILKWNGSAWACAPDENSAGSGSGDVTGPGSSNADGVVVFNGTTGKIIKELTGGSTGDVLTKQASGAGAWAAPVSGEPSDNDKGDITVTGSGLVWTIDNGVIGTDEIATDGVAAAEIAANAVGSSELASNAVTTAKILDSAVTESKLDFRDTPSDSQIATFNSGDGRLEWQSLEELGLATQLGPCGTDSRCVELDDTDGDFDYADDWQKAINDLAFDAAVETSVVAEAVVENSERFFGMSLDPSVATQETYDSLNCGGTQCGTASSAWIAIRRGGECRNGSLTATINADGTITGDVDATAISVGSTALNCSADAGFGGGAQSQCISGTSADYMNGPLGTGTCTRTGTAGITFDGNVPSCSCNTPSQCLSGCSVTQQGSMTVNWTTGSGDTSCAYDREAPNTVVWANNANPNGRIVARWASSGFVDDTTVCDYTYLTNVTPNPNEFRIEAPPGVDVVEFKSETRYCAEYNSRTPVGYDVPECQSVDRADTNAFPTLVVGSSWDGVEMACQIPTGSIQGSAYVHSCFRIGNETYGTDGTAAATAQSGNRFGLRMDGAPVISTQYTDGDITNGDDDDCSAGWPDCQFGYGWWLDGIDDSYVWVRPKATTGFDSSTIPVVVSAVDNSTIAISPWRSDAVNQFGNVYIDDFNFIKVQGIPSASTTPQLATLFIANTRADYKAMEEWETINLANGCKGYNLASGICTGLEINGISATGILTDGFPGAFTAANLRLSGAFEFVGKVFWDVTDGAPRENPLSVHCVHCNQVRIHASSADQTGAFEDVPIRVSGVVDNVYNDAIAQTASTPSFRNFQTITLDNWSSLASISPYRLVAVNPAQFAGPGMVDYVGTPDYVWTMKTATDMNAGGAACMEANDQFTSEASCSAFEAKHIAFDEPRIAGRIKVELLEDVPTTDTECEIALEINSACTACDTGNSEPAGGYVANYGGTDFWGRVLRDAGDYTWWGIYDEVDVGDVLTVEVRPVTGGTDCEDGSGCDCDNGLNAVRVTVDALPTYYDRP